MIEFRCTRKDRTGTPILFNTEIWDYAERIVGDYKPSLLKEPGKVNGVHFAESYLGATVEYQDIYYGENEPAIAGATVFDDDEVLVFDKEGLCVRTIQVRANTIILDNSVTKAGLEGFANFTALHEAGHFCIHQGVYKKNNDRIRLLDSAEPASSVVCCRKTAIAKPFYSAVRAFTPGETREHQANVFAAFAAMPRQTFIPYAQSMIRDVGFGKGIFVYNDKTWESDYFLDEILDKLKDTYGVSRTSAKIHLKELGLLISRYEYDRRKTQRQT